jgi:DNA polymerase
VIVVRDLSAIEARVNFWLAGQEDKVQAYREGKDLYCEMYKTMTGAEITKKEKNERFLGKTVVLGCLTGDNRVLTDTGVVKLCNITAKHKVWDGNNWVSHEGLIRKGRKDVIEKGGVTATPDHEIATPYGWFPWEKIANDHLFWRAAHSTVKISSVAYRPTIFHEKLPTFDLLNTGPDHRFTLVSDDGYILVHNCGYGLGWKKYQSMLRVGMLGDKGRILGDAIAAPLGVDQRAFEFRNAAYINATLPPGMDINTHSLHCACAQKIIQLFRDNNPAVPAFWDECQDALGWILKGERKPIGPKNVLRTVPEGILLPNGMIIRYVELQGETRGRRTEYSILKNRKKGEREKLYGGKVDENCDQALSRIIMTDAMLRMRDEGMKVVLTVHDEILVAAKESDAERTYHRMGEIMSTPPSWAPDLPLASEGGWGRSYVK